MKPIKSEELQGTTITGLKELLDNTNCKIAETKEILRVLNENQKMCKLELVKKQKIQTTSIIKIQKYKGFYSTTTDIEIYLDNIDKSGNLIDNVAFRRLQYSDRTQLSSMLVALYEEYGFKKIITSMKLPKAILKKYNVEFYKKDTPGNSIDRIRLNGFNNGDYSQHINASIKRVVC